MNPEECFTNDRKDEEPDEKSPQAEFDVGRQGQTPSRSTGSNPLPLESDSGDEQVDSIRQPAKTQAVASGNLFRTWITWLKQFFCFQSKRIGFWHVCKIKAQRLFGKPNTDETAQSQEVVIPDSESSAIASLTQPRGQSSPADTAESVQKLQEVLSEGAKADANRRPSIKLVPGMGEEAARNFRELTNAQLQQSIEGPGDDRTANGTELSNDGQ